VHLPCFQTTLPQIEVLGTKTTFNLPREWNKLAVLWSQPDLICCRSLECM